jgi:hypothetical protein
MLDAASEAVTFAQGKIRGDLDRDRQLALSLVKLIEIIGEAAARVTAPGRQATRTFRGATSSRCAIASSTATPTSTSIAYGIRSPTISRP